MAGWLVPALDAVTLAAQLTASPLQVALLSNAPHDLAGPLRFSPLLRGFDALFFSCEIGLCKPDSRVYEHVLRELGAAPHETLFIDDREDNIRAAATLGIRVHHYTGAAGLAALLQQLPLG